MTGQSRVQRVGRSGSDDGRGPRAERLQGEPARTYPQYRRKRDLWRHKFAWSLRRLAERVMP